MTGSGDGGDGVQAIVLPRHIPVHAPLGFVFEQHIKAIISADLVNLPIRRHWRRAKSGDGRPRALSERIVQSGFVRIADNQTVVRDGANHVVKLRLNCR